MWIRSLSASAAVDVGEAGDGVADVELAAELSSLGWRRGISLVGLRMASTLAT
jgi:hypothetical protein